MTAKMRDPEQVYQELKGLPPDLFDIPFWPELCDRLRGEIAVVGSGMKEHDKPILGALTFYGRSLVESGLPEQVAEIVFGSKTLVFDVSERIRGEAFVGDVLNGAPPGFDPPERETLSAFIRRCGCGVIVLENLQAFDVQAIETLADICDTGKAHESGVFDSGLSAENVIVIATAAVRLPTIKELAAAGLKLDDGANEKVLGPKTAFPVALWRDLYRRYPEHLRPWVYSRFQHRLHEYLGPRFRKLLRANRLDEPLIDYESTEAPVWHPGAAPAPEVDHRQVVDDVRPIIASAADRPVSISSDVFISYRTIRNAKDAGWLTKKLREQGLSVWLDKDSLDIPKNADLHIKAKLIRKLVAAVRTSRCMIAFAASMQPFRLPAGYTEEDALRRGLAMRQDAALIAWNWQKLEIDHAADVLIIDTTIKNTYVIQGGRVDPSFGYRRYADTEEMGDMVSEYLDKVVLRRRR